MSDQHASGVAAAITAGQIIAQSGTVHRTLIALVDLCGGGHPPSTPGNKPARPAGGRSPECRGVIPVS